MLIDLSPKDSGLASAILANAVLDEIKLVGCGAEASDHGVSLLSPFKISMDHPISRSVGVKDGVLAIESEFQLESVDSTEAPKLVFRLACVFRATYRIKPGFEPTTEQMDAFARGIAIFNCWPYVREYTQATAARMGLFPPPVPLLHIKGFTTTAAKTIEEAQGKAKRRKAKTAAR